MTEYVAFVGLVAVVVLIPGPAVVLVMQKAVTTGLRGALLVALGVLTADLVWAAAAAVGVTAVLVASEPAFLALRLIGAAYLVYLGARLLFARRHALPQPDLNTPRVPVRPLVAFRQGFLCDMTNPKTALVFTSANWNVAQTVTVTGADDPVDDGDAGFTVTTGSPWNATVAAWPLRSASLRNSSSAIDMSVGCSISPGGQCGCDLNRM